MYIKAPYNFVPLNKKVVIPHWGEQVSHDIPFLDSQSGSFRVKIKAHSPIFVMDGVKEEGTNEVKEFSKFQDTYFIPGSSIKGMIRSVLEMMSFSKLSNKVNDHRYAIRDLSPLAKDIYLNNFKIQEIHAGWLRKNPDETYTIEDCGIPGRISHRELDRYFGTDFNVFFSDKGAFNQREDEQKAAQYKYHKFGDRSRKNHFSFAANSAGRQIYEVKTDERSKEGTIVFTGQAGPRKRSYNGRWSGHHLEFIFFEKERDILVSEEVMTNFFFAYHDQDVNRHSTDWKYWREKLKEGEPIPVFFKKDNAGNVLHFGLSFLYKLPYKNSIREAIEHYQREEGYDLSEVVFGYVDTYKKIALKGRVHIGHAKAIASCQLDEKKKEVLSGPKASYYLNYIRQSVDENGKLTKRPVTLMDSRPEIAGWKRYPIHRRNVKSNPLPQGVSEKVLSHFIPLKSGAEFEFTIRYHNLKKIELGALLSALTFHNTPDTFHSLGMAKPLGYGKVSLSISGISTDEQMNYLQAYEAYMDAALENDAPQWHASEQIEALITMASEQQNTGNSELSYMSMGVGRGQKNYFVEAKKANEALMLYAKMEGIKSRNLRSLINLKDLQNAKQNIKTETALFKQKAAPLEALEEFRNTREKEFYECFEQEKAALLAKILAKKKEIKTREVEAREEQLKKEKEEREKREKLRREEKSRERQAVAQSRRPPLEEVDISDRKAFDELRKLLQKYLEAYHAQKYEALKAAHPQGGILPEDFHEELKNLIRGIYESRSKKEKKRWLRPFNNNAYLKKAGEWIGTEQARDLLEEWK